MNTRTSSTVSRLLTGAALAAAGVAASPAARADDTKPAPAAPAADAKPAADAQATTGAKPAADTKSTAKQAELAAAVQNTIFVNDPVSRIYDDVQKFKTENNLPIGVGAWHWWHMNRHSPHDLHYGLPTL